MANKKIDLGDVIYDLTSSSMIWELGSNVIIPTLDVVGIQLLGLRLSIAESTYENALKGYFNQYKKTFNYDI
jgi:hypothetical protein